MNAMGEFVHMSEDTKQKEVLSRRLQLRKKHVRISDCVLFAVGRSAIAAYNED